MNPAYQYRMTVKRWVDGDTFDAVVDLGFTVSASVRFRLLGVDTPERGEDGYAEAREVSQSACPVGSIFVASSVKAGDKYGRWLVEIPAVTDALREQGLDKMAFVA